jgi:hypothetical protein
MAHLPTWNTLPDDLKEVIQRNAAKYVRQQREEQANLNASLCEEFSTRPHLQRSRSWAISGAAARGRCQGEGELGVECWTLLEENVGKLG